MDIISVNGIACYGYHGGSEEEQRLGQRFLVDLELELDLGPAGRVDDLDLTVDYSRAIAIAREIVEGPPVHLLETVAERIAERLLGGFELLQAVRVRVHKPGTPVPIAAIGDVAVEIRRSRGG